MKEVKELLQLLELERIDRNLYRGQSHFIGSPAVFGGQVAAQALRAAMNTVPEDRNVHSLHGYFILPGDLDHSIIFQVETIRDGGSFTTRRVKAIQHGEVIFLMAASFQLKQEGFDHQIAMPEVKPPEELVSWDQIREQFGESLPEGIRKFLEIDRPIEFRPVELTTPAMGKSEPLRHVWMKAKGEMPNHPGAHSCVLTYASDYNLLATALLPHGPEAEVPNIKMASLDHAMWFHRPFRIDDWLLYAIDSPSASNARGFTRGNVFDRNGMLIASVTQEGLIRPKK
jgi:acyl-CoA thioesterase-2